MTSPAEDKQRDTVRELARQVAAIAASDENAAIQKRWRDVNALRKPDRAPVLCVPVGCWREILPEDQLQCTDPWLRSLEDGFRRTLFKREVGDDTPVESWYPVGAVFDCDPPNTWGVDIGHHLSSVAGGAWAYDPPLKTEADFDKLRLPRYTYNDAKTQQALSQAHDLLGDMLPVRRVCGPPLGATLCGPAAYLRGLNETMMDMAAEPRLMHRLMAYLRDAALGALQQVADTGLLTPNGRGAMMESDPFGPESVDGTYTYKNLWCMANSQEFDQVSPAMWEEFLLAYQRPIFEQFGLVGYGCCEDLTHKIAGVLSIPNLRMFVSSAWTDIAKVADACGTKYTIMWRQKASAVVFPDDVSGIRRHLDDGMRRLKGCYVQIVLRELQTLAGHADRLHVWTRLAKDAAARYA